MGFIETNNLEDVLAGCKVKVLQRAGICGSWLTLKELHLDCFNPSG
jgi:hypothetical protein